MLSPYDCSEIEALSLNESRSGSNFVCVICSEELSTIATSGPNTTVTSSEADYTGASDSTLIGQTLYCGHAYCRPCLSTFLKFRLLEFSNPFPLYCAQPGCPYEINDYDAEPVLTSKSYAKWKKRKAESDMRNKIYCPNKRCSALLDVAHVKDNENAVIVCHQCLHVACVQCRVPWHNGYACHEYNVLPPGVRNNEDEEVFRMARQYRWARCINCRTLVELYEGSNHITCQCGTQFCYQCNGPWNELTRQCTRHQCSLWSKEMLELEEQRRNTNTANTQPPDDNLSMFSNQRRLSLSSTTSSNWFIHTSYHRGLPELNPPKNTTEPVASTSNFTTSTAATAAADILPITPPSVINATTSASNSSSTPPSEPVTYQCPKCFKKFLSEHALGVHTRTTRDHDNFEPNGKQPQSKATLTCCSRIFDNEHNLWLHQQSVRCFTSVAKSNTRSTYPISTTQANNQSINLTNMINGPKRNLPEWARGYIINNICCYCNVKFNSRDNLQSHLRNTTEHGVYYCCDRLYTSQIAFDQHRLLGGLCKLTPIAHSASSATTTVSPLALPLPRNGLRDLGVNLAIIAAEGPASGNAATIYTNIRNRKCYDCSRSFPSLSALDNHLRNCVHDVFACCGRLFVNHQSIAEHRAGSNCRRTIGNKPSSSSSSSSSSSRPSVVQPARKLNVQLEVSTSLEMLYKVLGDISLYRAISSLNCCYCNRKFNTTDELMVHLVNTSLHEVHQCCTILFKDANSLGKHKRIHHS